MSKPTIEGFVEFVNAQPADRLVPTGAWSSCAVGQYMDSIDPSKAYGRLQFGNEANHVLMDVPYDFNDPVCTVCEKLANNSWCKANIPTYGDFADLIVR